MTAQTSPSHPFRTAVPTAAGDPRFVLRGLDGLRALAVGLVVLYHLWPTLLPGGMIGVDLFFVISGYLITALLLREAAYTGKMNLPQFWIRRLRRLVPAMLLCLVVVSSLAFCIGGDVLVDLPRQILSALTYTSNWTGIAAGNEYFRTTSPELFTNFWSLAVEEQFYLLWPLTLVLTCMFVLAWKRRRLVPAGIGLASALLMAMVLMITENPTRVYYGLDTHAFGLMLGASLALLIPWSMYPPKPGYTVHALERQHSGLRNVLRLLIGWISLMLLPVLAMHLSDHRPAVLLPWGLLAASALGLGVVQALLPDVRGTAAAGLRALLSLPPLVWIGRRSYGIYLWHWPLMVLAHYALPSLPGAVRAGLVLVLTLLISAASYTWLEAPVRRRGFGGALRDFAASFRAGESRRRAALATVCVSALCVAGTAGAWVRAPEMTEAERLVAEGQQRLQHDAADHDTADSEDDDATTTASPSPTPTDQQTSAYDPAPGGQDVSVVGDSVTVASAGALQQELDGVSIDAKVSRNVTEGLKILRQMEQKGQLGRIVVVSLSTNTAMTAEDIQALEQIAAQGKKRQIVLVTGQAPPELGWVAESNRVIREAAAASPHLTVADWQQASQGRPELLAQDGIHPGEEGQLLYAQTVAEAVKKAKATLAEQTRDPQE